MKELNTNKGFTLTETMIALGIVGGMSLVIMTLIKDQAQMSARSDAHLSYAQAQSDILSYFISPANCNANFFNKTAGILITPGSIYRCNKTTTTDDCRAVGGSAVTAVPVVTSSWSANVTKISERVRLSSFNYTINTASGTLPSLAKVSITANFDLKNGLNQTFRTVTKTYSTLVVVSPTTNKVLGCPRAWNSTVLY